MSIASDRRERGNHSCSCVIASEAKQSHKKELFIPMRLPRFARNDTGTGVIATLAKVARNYIQSSHFGTSSIFYIIL